MVYCWRSSTPRFADESGSKTKSSDSRAVVDIASWYSYQQGDSSNRPSAPIIPIDIFELIVFLASCEVIKRFFRKIK